MCNLSNYIEYNSILFIVSAKYDTYKLVNGKKKKTFFFFLLLLWGWIYITNTWKTLGCIWDVDKEERVAKKILACVPKPQKKIMHMQTLHNYMCENHETLFPWLK